MTQNSNHKDNKQQNTQFLLLSSQTTPQNQAIQATSPQDSYSFQGPVDDSNNSRNTPESHGQKKQRQEACRESSKVDQKQRAVRLTNKEQEKMMPAKKDQLDLKDNNVRKAINGPNSENANLNPTENRVFRNGQLIINQKKQIQYKAIELIGTGTFGQVLSVVSLMRNSQGVVNQHLMALKVIKNQPAYISQGLMEIKNLREISKYEQMLKEDGKNYLKLYDGFMWEGHLCIAMELLDNNILNILQTSGYKGIQMKWIEKWTKELLMCLAKIHKLGIIHCDIKPQNIMFRPQLPEKPILIDFSSSCSNGSPMFTYIQSRFYRSPEVLLATKPYTNKVDMWSLGCVLAEMYLGLPIFPGGSAYDQLAKIFKVLGKTFDQQTINMIRTSQTGHYYFTFTQIPTSIKEVAKQEQQSNQYSTNNSNFQSVQYGEKNLPTKFEVRLKTYKEFKEVKFEKAQMNQDYFNLDSLDDLISIRNPPVKDIQTHELFVDLVKKMLVFNPLDRISAEEAFLHPFIGGIYAQLETLRNLEDLLEQGRSKLEGKS